MFVKTTLVDILVLRLKASTRDEIVLSVMSVADKMSTCREYYWESMILH